MLRMTRWSVSVQPSLLHHLMGHHSAGIQIADMVAYVVRKYQEEVFDASPPIGDLYLYAIRRWYRMIMQKTVDLTTDDGEERRGVYFMPVGGF